MSTFIGREISLGVGVEAVRGTAQPTADRWVRKTTMNVIPRAERVIDDTTFGRLEDAERVRTVRRWSEGDVEGILHADVAGYFFLNLYGEVESTVVSGEVTEHEFTKAPNNIQNPTLTLFTIDGGVRNSKVPGAVVSTLELTASTDQYVRFSTSFLGREAVSSDEEATLSDEYDWVSRDIAVKIAETSEGLAVATPLKLKNLTVSWDNSANADFVFGNYSPDNIYNGAFVIEGSFTRNYTDQTFEDLYTTDAFRYMGIDIIGEADLGSSNNPELHIVFNKIQVTDWNRTSAGDDLVTEDVSFKAFYNVTDEAQSSITLQNLTPSYNAVEDESE
jgi:hypothetical protein